MARAIWSGTVSFGLLNVPVKLYSAVARRRVSLREVRESDGSRIRHKRVAEADGEEVPYEKIAKAFEIGADRYVPLTKEELSGLDPEKTRSIEIQDFVELDEVDPVYFETPYYLGPAEGAEKAYALLARAMESAGKAAIARFVFRNREHLAALRSLDGVLTMTTMRFADEVVPPAELDDAIPSEKPKVAKRIESLSTEFDPASYRDEYRESLMELIERKAAGEEVVTAPGEAPAPTKAPDLMAALEESIAATQSGRGKARKGKGGARKPAKPKKTKAKSRS
jgi:DNA end-binding protein Ku